MYVRDECEYAILKRAEELLHIEFNWNIKDDEMTGFINEDVFELIDKLCDEILKLRGGNNE